MDSTSYLVPLSESRFQKADIALNSELVVIAFSSSQDECIEILAFNRSTGESHAVKTDIRRLYNDPTTSGPHCQCIYKIEFLHDSKDLVIFVCTNTHYRHYVCPQDYLPYNSNLHSLSSLVCSNTGTIISRPHRNIHWPHAWRIGAYISHFTGIMVEMTVTSPSSDRLSMSIYNPKSGEIGNFIFPVPKDFEGEEYECIAAWSTGWATVFLPCLGEHRYDRGIGYLDQPLLLRYDPDDFSVSIRPIVLPYHVGDCYSYSVDEGRSEIVIVTGRPTLYRLSYAANPST